MNESPPGASEAETVPAKAGVTGILFGSLQSKYVSRY